MFYITVRTARDNVATFGPYTEIVKGAGAIITGIREGGQHEDVIECTVEHGGYCDTCGYDYTEMIVAYGLARAAKIESDPVVYHFEIEWKD